MTTQERILINSTYGINPSNHPFKSNNMNHNPNNVRVGQTVLLDAEYNNATLVIIDELTALEMFAVIHSAKIDPDDPNHYKDKPTWKVMTYRLSPRVDIDLYNGTEMLF